jgi:hypothetical protein
VRSGKANDFGSFVVTKPYNLSDAERQARAERMRQRNADPAFIKLRDEARRRMDADPAVKARASKRAAEQMRKNHADPNFIAALDAGWQKYWRRKQEIARSKKP